jgi:hypothetical protein
MDMRDYSTLHLDINSSKGTVLLLLRCMIPLTLEVGKGHIGGALLLSELGHCDLIYK